MSVHSTVITVNTRGFNDVHNITSEASAFLDSSDVQSGLFCACVPGSTAGITTIEYEEGALDDLRSAIERIAPADIHYEHDKRWGDGNGFSHVRAALLGPSLCVPVEGGRLRLGTWQQIVLIDFDNRPRRREVIFEIVGE
ncbi:MAG TPA: secondary thiamine-phosphate synthase enzyme YjbQ [Bacteroidota bacterium]|nr:secondary thiamine-phosphate synthase enzyme YjbQ [Bacteroidota bacterium]